jgi:hypothetical protein
MFDPESRRPNFYDPEPERSFVDAFVGELVASALVFAVFAGIGIALALFI